MKRLLSLLMILLLTSTAFADTYELHTPDSTQLSKDQAFAFANSFWLDLCGASIESAVKAGTYEASFGPGHQWGVETQDDCWAIYIRGVQGPVGNLFLILHGTPNQSEDNSANISVLYWSLRNKESLISYACAIPDVTMVDRYKAVQYSIRDFAAVANVSEDRITFNENGQFTLTKWAMRDICEDIGDLDGDVPVWSIALTTDDQYADYLINAYDGTVVYRRITEKTE